MTSSDASSRYTILQKLAAGGMAELYLGRMSGISGLEKPVAIKRILPEFAKDKDFVEMFLDEARVAATLQHPNIVQTYDVVAGADGYFISMEYLQGADVRAIGRALSRSGQGFPVEFAVQIVNGVLAGLHYAHEQRDGQGRRLEIVHRDVSPHNTFVTYDGSVKLLDFGVAKAANNLVKTEGGIKGKVRYLSPEQCVSAPVDRRSDVYSAGVMLYEMLTHQRVHHGDNPYATMRSIVNDPVVPPREHDRKIPRELEIIVMRALEKKRSQRYQSAQEFQRALEKFSRDQGIFPSAIRLGQWVREVVPDAPSSAARPAGERSTTPAQSAPQSTPHADFERLGGVTVVRVKGRVDEGFEGVSIGRQLSGVVVIDLERLERMTSFGIRAWLEMMKLAEESVDALYFARAPEAFLNQVSMVRGVIGSGRIVSLFVPFLCRHDQREFHVLVEGEAALELLRDGRSPRATCPLDPAHEPVLDDEIEVFRGYLKDFEAYPPRDVQKALEQIATGAVAQEVRKELHGGRTRLVVQHPLDGSVRWKRLLDGVDGEVSLDLGDVARVTDDGVRQLVAALDAVAEDLDALEVVGATVDLWAALRGSPFLTRKVRLASLRVQAACPEPTCDAWSVPRMARALPPDHRAGQFGLDLCRLCNTELAPLAGELDGVPGFERRATPAPAPARRAAVPAPASRPAPPTAPVEPAPVAETAASGCLGAMLALFTRSPGPPNEESPR